MMKWRPIETAPKDIIKEYYGQRYGARILGVDGAGWIATCLWWESADGYGSNFLTDGGTGFLPTHWMPLPDPPSGGG